MSNQPPASPPVPTTPPSKPANPTQTPLLRSVPTGYPATTALPLWPEEDYADLARGASARKLRESAVAPLVAAARGYRSVDINDFESLKMDNGLSGTTKGGRQLKAMLGFGAMLIPWHLPGTSVDHRPGRTPTPSISQFRPLRPAIDADGRPGKYVFLAGVSPILDVHPATPPEWLGNSATFLVTEGVIKGDAGITGLLRSAGVTDAELSWNAAAGLNAIDQLRTLMERIPENDRTLILSIGGVANWHNSPEWSSLNIKKSRALIAFDGDTATNPNVWRQASQMWQKLLSKGAAPALIDLDIPGRAGDKIGLDDYLATVGTWTDLKSRTTALPDNPSPLSGFESGDWRIDEDGMTTSEMRVLESEDGSRKEVWKKKVNFGGRILSKKMLRAATEDELRTGDLDLSDDLPSTTSVEIEINWREAEPRPGDPSEQRGVIRGPSSILSESPQEWHRPIRGGAVISSGIQFLPEWPPGPEWLKALKSHRRPEITSVPRWSHGGWVPTATGEPVFIIGKTVVGKHGESNAAEPGVVEADYGKIGDFGVIAAPTDEAELAAIKRVWATYSIGWNDPKLCALALAMALRPLVPFRPSTTVYASGTSNSGKSHFASMVLSFWQSQANNWTNKKLPGGGADTAAAIEARVSKLPLWVIDDIPPGADVRATDAAMSKIEQLIRDVANNQSKGRQSSGMQAQASFSPRAMLLITAEMESSVTSIARRLILAPMQRPTPGVDSNGDRFNDGSVNNHAFDDLVNIQQVTGEASMVTHAAAKMIASGDLFGEKSQTWSQTNVGWQTAFVNAIKAAGEVLGGSGGAGILGDYANSVADIGMGLVVWRELLLRNGLEDEAEQAAVFQEDLYDLMLQHASSTASQSPGSQAVEAIRSLLSSGRAYVENGDEPGAPPVFNDADSDLTNSSLGWSKNSEGVFGHSGTRVGYLVRKDGKDILIFEAYETFQQIRKQYPGLIPPGMTDKATWSSAWSDGLCVPEDEGWLRDLDSHSKRKTNIIRVQRPGGRVKDRIRGIPFYLNYLMTGVSGSEQPSS